MMKLATYTLSTLLAFAAIADESSPPATAAAAAAGQATHAATPTGARKARKQEKKAKRQVLRKRAQALRAETGPKSEGPHDNASAASEHIEAGKTKANEGAASAPATN